MRRGTSILMLGLAMAAIAAPSASANYLYWPNSKSTTIGRAELGGGSLNNGFLTTTDTAPGDSPRAVAVDSHFIYWAHGNAIGRANLDGTQRNPDFIPSWLGVRAPNGVAVDSKFIYWSGPSGIGRAFLNGSQPNNSFIPDLGSPCGVAVDQNFVYYTVGGNAIARAPAGGDPPDDGFIPVPGGTDCGVAVNDGLIYWSEGGATTGTRIGRASLDTGQAQHSLISGIAATGVAVTPEAIYWGSGPTGGTIGRANLDGTGANQGFLGIGSPPDATPTLLAAAPSNLVTLGPPDLNKKKGTAKISAGVPGPGTLVLDDASLGTQAVASRRKHRKKDPTVRRMELTVPAAGPVLLRVKPAGRLLRKLRRTGHGHANLGVTFTPAGVAGVPGFKAIQIPLRHR